MAISMENKFSKHDTFEEKLTGRLQPTGDWMIVEVIKEGELKSAGGIFLPEQGNEVRRFRVTAIGPAIERNSFRQLYPIKVGDVVLAPADAPIDILGNKFMRFNQAYAIQK